MERLVIGNSRIKGVVLTFGSLGFVVVGAFILINGDGDDRWIGWMSVAFFGDCSLTGLWMLFDQRPRIVVDDNGIYDRTLGVGQIPWSEIDDAYIQSIKGNDFICLELRNQHEYLERMSAVNRSMAKAN